MPRLGLDITTFATSLLDCFCHELESSPGGKPCACEVIPGQQVTMDFCGPCGSGVCGMAWVRLDSVYPSTRFPIQVQDSSSCTVPLAARFAVGIHRCLPTIGENGDPPSAVAQTNAALIGFGDMAAGRAAVECCAAVEPWRGRDRALGSWTPYGPQGDCGGGFWTVTVRIG